MSCLKALLWLPLLALGGFIGFMAGTAVGDDGTALIGAILGVIGSQIIQLILWGDRRRSFYGPPPWWNQ